MAKIVLVCGARPNFMKIAPLMRAIEKRNILIGSSLLEPLLVHTGQHYDYEMSQVFFENLEIPDPDIYLGVGSGSHAEQIGKVMVAFEKALCREKIANVIVVGDVNSTLATSLAAAKLNIPVAHVEAGLRSYDKTMPEELNRRLIDAVSDHLFTPSLDANINLLREGVPENKIFLVGNVMIDTLFECKEKAQKSHILSRLNLEGGGYGVLTLHRPGNVDDEVGLQRIFKALNTISQRIPIIFPCHPRTRKAIEKSKLGHLFQLVKTHNNNKTRPATTKILLVEPLGYLDFVKLMTNAIFVMTDSGGIQEESTALNVPCLTLRDNTERPITITQGTNTLVGNDGKIVIEEAFRILDGKGKKGICPKEWDGKAAERVVEVLSRKLLG